MDVAIFAKKFLHGALRHFIWNLKLVEESIRLLLVAKFEKCFCVDITKIV